MPRAARLVLPGLPHHVTQRGNRRQPTFFGDDDYLLYLALLRHGCRKAGTTVWAWCLMPNHVHLILVPADTDGLRAALAPAHTRYTMGAEGTVTSDCPTLHGRSLVTAPPHAIRGLSL